MKKSKYSILYLIILIFLAGCQTEGEFESTSYNSYSITFLYPSNIDANYEFVLEGNKGTSGYISKSKSEVELNVLKKDNQESVFSGKIAVDDLENINSNLNIRLIAVDGKVDIYDESNYISFIPTILYTVGTEDDYVLSFNNQTLENGKSNYIPKGKTEGLIQIKKNNESADLCYTSNPITIAEDMKLSLMQLAEMDFMEIPEDTEAEPTQSNTVKVRFFYIPDETLTMDEIRVDFYRCDATWDWATPLPLAKTLTLKKGELSPYILFDLSDPIYDFYFYDITDVKTGEKIVDYLTYFSIVSMPLLVMTGDAVKYKKATEQFIMGGLDFKVWDSLSTLW
ncbi:hypothetical protein [Bacteroides clarus]|uniref:Uncharacterized protein n=1 Tax=Bacteroides clarus TaxID=626929 RepID=A0A1Y3YM78_9BACE|nr:hypothetical protein [Bacteroides clarus]OUN98924.1 hypothetical protein B5F97_16415 [Bacteroides clarus]